MKFYPSDWRADPALRSCTIAARGLWIEMMCIMHEAVPYGSLLIKSQRIDKKRLASLCGVPEKECFALLLELEGFGVFERDEDGTIYSRRMRRDNAKAETGRREIAKRWGTEKRDRSPNRLPNRSDGAENTGEPITLEARSQNDDGVTRAGASLISPEAFEITDALEKACGFNLPEETPPGWYGCAMWAQKCLNEGWVGVVMVETAKGVALRKKGGFIESFKYLEKPLAQAMAEHRAPLPQVEMRQPEKLTVTSNAKPRSQIIQAIGDLRREIASFDGPSRGPDGVCSEASGTPPRLLSNG
jgi:hypothetical protein